MNAKNKTNEVEVVAEMQNGEGIVWKTAGDIEENVVSIVQKGLSKQFSVIARQKTPLENIMKTKTFVSAVERLFLETKQEKLWIKYGGGEGKGVIISYPNVKDTQEIVRALGTGITRLYEATEAARIEGKLVNAYFLTKTGVKMVKYSLFWDNVRSWDKVE